MKRFRPDKLNYKCPKCGKTMNEFVWRVEGMIQDQCNHCQCKVIFNHQWSGIWRRHIWYKGKMNPKTKYIWLRRK